MTTANTKSAIGPLLLPVAVLALACSSGRQASAQNAVSVSFGSAAAMRPADHAGAVAHVGHWNNIQNLKAKASITLTKVVDQSGRPVLKMTVTVTGGSSAFGINSFDTPQAKTVANDARLYDGVFDQDNGPATTVTVTGIPFAHYDVYFYRVDDGATRAGIFTIGSHSLSMRGGKGNPSASGKGYVRSQDATHGSGQGITQGNYVEFETLTGRTLKASFTAVNAGDQVQRNKVAGFQIVERK